MLTILVYSMCTYENSKTQYTNFHKFVIQRILLIMFKNEVGLVPKPISQLFTRNNEYHDYNARHSGSLHLSVGRGEAIYRTFSFHGINLESIENAYTH